MKKQYIFLLLLLIAGCKEKYIPLVVAVGTNYLVVEGLINSGQAATSIVLSRTGKLTEARLAKPETGALVVVEGEDNTRYFLSEQAAGVYSIAHLSLNNSSKYRLYINTSDGKEYASDYVEVKQSPVIDSVAWRKENNEVVIRVNTHDPKNNARYYRWTYEETWEYRSVNVSRLEYRNGVMYKRDSTNQVWQCWRSSTSSNIELGSSAKLEQDIIQDHQLVKIANGEEKTTIEYSILVKQYALTKEAYDFWSMLKKNTQQIGGTFDAQPTQLSGNIHCITDSTKPVIGFISAGTVSEKRIFINRLADLSPWKHFPDPDNCGSVGPIKKQSEIDDYFGLYGSLYTPIDSAFDFFGNYIGIVGATINCVDCRNQGGTITKPSFWPY